MIKFLKSTWWIIGGLALAYWMITIQAVPA